MPSPFPGMDPYLEDPRTMWPDLHHDLISEIRAQLTAQLRPKYVAQIEERVYISDDRDPGTEGDCEYLMHVSRNDDRPQAMLWAVRLDQRLPELRIPLRPEDEDARLDLQAVLNSVYERAGYDLIADYSREAVPPLPAEWRGWAQNLLAEMGPRS